MSDSLEDRIAEQARRIAENSQDVPSVDLATLLGEMAALRSEVRAETRSSRAMREELSASLQARSEAAANPDPVRALIDIADRLDAAISVAQTARTERRWWHVFSPPRRPHPSWIEGLLLTRARVQEHLGEYDVHPIDTTGHPFDPQLMTAVERRHDSARPDEIVLETTLCGYLRGSDILRFAHVVVNRTD